jgi:transposase
MCLRPQTSFVIPFQTWRIARAAFPNGSLCMQIRDELGSIFRDEQFAGLFPRRGQPAEAPARLALVSLLQYAENIPDRQAADAVRGRIDWKYALGLQLDDPGFDSTVVSEFRTRLLEGGADQQRWIRHADPAGHKPSSYRSAGALSPILPKPPSLAAGRGNPSLLKPSFLMTFSL